MMGVILMVECWVLGDVAVLGCFRMIQRFFSKKKEGMEDDDINQILGMMGKLCRQVGDIIRYGDIIGLIRNKIPSGEHTKSY
jgi:hypothetical protein